MVVYVAVADTSPANVETPVTPRFVSVAASMKQRLQQRPAGTVKRGRRSRTKIEDPQIAQTPQIPG